LGGKIHKKLRYVLGMLFIIAQFIPLGAYHFVGEPYITGGLYNILFPHGILSFILGLSLISYDTLKLERFIRVNYLLMFGGLLILLTPYFIPRECLLGFIYGVDGDFDVDGIDTGFLIGLIGIFSGMVGEVLTEPDKISHGKWGQAGSAIGLIASLGTLVFWFILLFINPYGGKIELDSLVPISFMVILALIGLFSSLRLKSTVMFAVFILSFIPFGYYMLLTPGIFKWIGIFSAMYLPSAILMAINNRKGEAKQ